MFRWTEIQCSPSLVGNFTPSGNTVKVTSGHKVAQMDGFALVVRRMLLHICIFYFNRHTSEKLSFVSRTLSFLRFFQHLGQNLGAPC